MVTARRETYARPGALPEVTPGTLADDLARRDFTINAMAPTAVGRRARARWSTRTAASPTPAAGIVRALRPDAFEEDPSRLVRAARYAARLGFLLDGGTAAAAREAAPALDAGRRAGGRRARAGSPRSPRLRARWLLLGSLGVPWLSGPRDAAPWRERFAAIDDALARPGAPALPAWALRLGEALDPDTLAGAAVPGLGARAGRGGARGGGAGRARLDAGRRALRG